MKILGVSAFYHDSAAAIIDQGVIIAAAQEERFSRVKNDSEFPKNAILFCLKRASCTLSDIDAIVFYDKPFLKFERLIETYVTTAPKGFRSFSKSMPIWLKEKLFLKRTIVSDLVSIGAERSIVEKLYFSDHHTSHAASAFYPSGYKEAVILTMDGVGEWATTTVSIGKDNKIERVKEIRFPHSMGLLYSAFTYYTGFKVNSGEYKLMGLAPYGKPIFTDEIKQHLVDIKPDGSFRLNLYYFDYMTGLKMVNRRFERLFGRPARREQDSLEQFHMDIASSIQHVLEEVVLKIGQSIADEYKIGNLCLAGGVALNCVANGKLQAANIFDNIWVQPAAGDAGGALGAALALWHDEFGQPKCDTKDSMQGSYLGPDYSQTEIIACLKRNNASFKEANEEDLLNYVALALAENKVVGWFQGRSEFGPRALGNRSILANPQSEDMQQQLNLKVKFRESFRPFAPAVLAEEAHEWFSVDSPAPYMQFVKPVHQKKQKIIKNESKDSLLLRLSQIRSDIPAVTHVDYSARVQTVDGNYNPKFYQLIKVFKSLTGCPILINTSFNVRGEPIVNSPDDAYHCFLNTNIDLLVLGNCLIESR
ncbi:Decarbamoylnovobiocin carbamoyltransferase [BD1-7 clade bacterium]|uniref:Decarbamoylnovobiocin carbamoyltransferase n=1 Tax=BD1-7 clade bacterium TaxID=2029982 RepID=A0A5S9QI82_9GAMM|nr:Decarbamoylnovobiocin carbamoyltransferase [BD1-7 clade bacterium]CAA0117789.1 Decarbamoylnovobiocin carbamoyltransferase [BD1-7 clade bacterium]